MASKSERPGSAAEATKTLLLSTIGHLMGVKEGKDGKLAVTVGESSKRRSDTINVDNLRTDCAQQWRPGALLDAVGGLGVLPQLEIGRIREKLKIRKVTPEPAPAKVVPSSVNSGASLGPGGNSNSKANLQPRVHSPLPPTFQKPTFPAPRNVRADINTKGITAGSGASTSNQDDAEPPQKKQFTFSLSAAKQNTDAFSDRGSDILRAKPDNRPNPSSLYSVPISKPPVKPLVAPNIDEPPPPREVPTFRTAHEYMLIEDKKKGIVRNYNTNGCNAGVSGLRRPTRTDQGKVARAAGNNEKPVSDNPEVVEIMEHESMKNIDPKMVEAIVNEVVQIAETKWDDIAGLEPVKTTIQEIIILPMLRPDLFTGIRSPAKGILFFGPPGTGKTMFGRLIASQSRSTFFNISASSLTSKWIGDGEKMVRALFAVARVKQPSVIFIDEIDSILTQRSDTEHESSRRLKTEFLIQFDGAATQNEDRILVIGVTNRPQELDEAARRRLVKRIYIPLPDHMGRKQIVKNLTKGLTSSMEEEDYDSIAEMSAGYSGADMNSLVKEAALGPLRDVPRDALQDIHASQVRSIQMKDFASAQRVVKSSVAELDVIAYEEWNAKFGCHS